MDDLMKELATGNKPEDYYYKYDKAGRKCYYSIIDSEKRISKNNIPSNLLDKIKERNLSFTAADLLVQKKVYLLEIEKLNKKLSEINEKLNEIDLNFEDPNIIEERKKQLKEDEQRRKDFEKDRKKFFYNLYQELETPKINKEKTENLLQQLNINNKEEWKKWLSVNHPDKGGDNDLCAKVISMGKMKGW